MTQDADKKAAAMHEATDIGTKLTEAQRQALGRLYRISEYHIGGLSAVRALKRRGLTETNEFGCTSITEAGRSLLRSLQEKSHG